MLDTTDKVTHAASATQKEKPELLEVKGMRPKRNGRRRMTRAQQGYYELGQPRNPDKLSWRFHARLEMP